MTITQGPLIAAPTRATARPRRRRGTLLLGTVIGGTAAIWLVGGGLGQLADPGGAWLVLGQISGIVAALAALVGLVLVARPTWLERTEGLDRLWSGHRTAGITTTVAVVVHLVASSIGMAGGSIARTWSQYLAMLSGSAWMVAASVSAVLFVVVATTSWRRVRRRMSYETWLGIHVVGYMAVLLGFAHQITLGTDFSANTPVGHWWWIAVFSVAAAIVLWSRLGGLLGATLTGRATIARVTPVAPQTFAIEMRASGRRVRRAVAGQFFLLRVLTGDLWWQAHPISLSARPRDGLLRFTIKANGDATARMASLRPGTRVVLEGPYGTFTVERAAGRPVLLIGGGVGTTVIRAVLADCSAQQTPVVVVRAKSPQHVPHLAEIRAMVTDRGGRLFVVDGPRSRYPHHRPFTADALCAAVPDIGHRDVFVCGPPAMERELESALRAAGAARIHIERFGV